MTFGGITQVDTGFMVAQNGDILTLDGQWLWISDQAMQIAKERAGKREPKFRKPRPDEWRAFQECVNGDALDRVFAQFVENRGVT